MDDDRPTVLELFAGIGGLSLGLERAGFQVVGQVEINPFCREVLAQHWPTTPRHDDVRTAIEWWLSEPRPHVDCVAGGYPCQPDSNAGPRLGTEDDRWLWPDFARMIHALRVTQESGPRYVIGENVMGHRTRGLRFVLRDLERLGYTARAGIVAADEMGAPHERKRIFVVAELADADRQGWAERSGSREDSARRREPADGAGGVADANGPGRPPGGGMGQTWSAAERARWWAAEPGVVRVVHGLPGRVDRVTSLGNAIVPAVGEFVGHLTLSGAWRDA